MPPAKSSTRGAASASGKGTPRVIHLVPCDGYGGVETAARSAANSPDLACDLTVYFLAGRTVAEGSRRIVDHPDRRLNDPRTLWAAAREITLLGPDVLVCSLWRSMLVGMAVKRLRPATKLVVFLHTTGGTHPLDRITQRLALRAADALWADSETTLKAFGKRTAKPLRKISLILEHRAPLPEARLAPRFVSWGRLHRHKGHDRSLELLALLVSRGIDARLEIWGADGGSGDALRNQCDSLGLSDRVRFAGSFDPSRLAEVAGGHSFYLSLSRLEGFGMSVAEAMQLGLVPVATPVGEIARYVRDGENGLLVDADQLSVAADRIAKLLQSPDNYRRMSLAAAQGWRAAPLYAEDFCAAALEVARVPHATQ